jgi:hypothetical protein
MSLGVTLLQARMKRFSLLKAVFSSCVRTARGLGVTVFFLYPSPLQIDGLLLG